MSRTILLALLPAFFLTAVLMPAPSHAQEADPSYEESYGDFGYTLDEYTNSFSQNEGTDEKEKDTAVWQYSKQYKKNLSKKEGPVDLLPQQGQRYIYFLRKPGLKSNEAALRLISPLTVTGCVNVIPPVATVRRTGRTMLVQVKKGEVTLDRTTRYSPYGCRKGPAVASTDVILNRDEIADNRVHSMTIQSGDAGGDTFDVELIGDTLTLLPKTTSLFKPYTGAPRPDPLSYNFYTDNTVILYAPAAPKEADISAEVIRLAQTKGMVEEGFQTPSGIYFNDQSGTLAGSLAYGASAYVGKITAEETFQGKDGPYQHKSQVDVYARLPGAGD